MTTALIAEDEPLLAQALQQELTRAWPALQLLGVAGDGKSAVTQALALRPDVLFLDVRMPGATGLEAATDLADQWPAEAPFPLLVFVTAYDQYAVLAFEAQAVDYLLKPVLPERLKSCVARLQARLAQRGAGDQTQALEQAVAQLRQVIAPAGQPTSARPAPLQVIQASAPGSGGQTLLLVPLAEVLYLEAADKYVRVLTAAAEHLIRTPLKELLPQLDENLFWQVHRSLVVRAEAIASVERDEAGRLTLRLRQRPEKLPVSRLYAQRFHAM